MPRPRLEPLPVDAWDDEIRELLGATPLNIFATLAHHPKLLKRWLVFGTHVLGKSTLPGRDRELLILRTGWNCRCAYEWGQHVGIASAEGIDAAEIARVAEGPDAPGWTPFERALLRAADELHADACLTDATYDALARHYDSRQMLDLVFTAGQYRLVSMALNTFGVERDDAAAGVPMPDRP